MNFMSFSHLLSLLINQKKIKIKQLDFNINVPVLNIFTASVKLYKIYKSIAREFKRTQSLRQYYEDIRKTAFIGTKSLCKRKLPDRIRNLKETQELDHSLHNHEV